MKNIDSISPNSSRQSPTIYSSPVPPKPNSINLLKPQKAGRGKRILKRILSLIALVILFLGALVIIRASNLSDKIFVGQKTTFFGKIVALFDGGDSGKLTGEDLGQVNVLLLGIGGEGHDGPYLTDTMILAQIRPDINQMTLTSIPRDYWTDMPASPDASRGGPGGGQEKINSAFALGIGKNLDWNQAGADARQVVENISGLQIPYFAVMDFSGFEQAVNQVGGVDVTVDRTFTDSEYPDSGTGYLPPVTFTAGPEHMDGTRALEFARSRHAPGIEGSDFARSQRQQKIIEAFKAKLLSMNVISGASTINQLLDTFANHFHTNLSPAELYRLYSLVKGKNPQILSLSLDLDTHIICNEITADTGAYILTPCPGKTPQDVQNFFKDSFAIAKITDEHATVWLASSTGNRAAYDTAFRKLTNAGLTVYELSYSKDDLSQTIVYQVSSSTPASTEFIKNELNATEVTLPPPGVTLGKNNVDVIVVLGTDAPVEAAPAPYTPPPARIATTTSSTVPSMATSNANSTSSKEIKLK